MYSTETVFPPSISGGTSGILIVQANGGSVVVSYEIDGDWVTMASFTNDGAYQIDRRAQWRITPSGGAVYDVQ